MYVCHVTGHPKISPSAHQLRRSVEELHAWEARRQIRLHELAIDRAEDQEAHFYDAYTFQPNINHKSRRMALRTYAVSPDPARPWTTSPLVQKAPVAR